MVSDFYRLRVWFPHLVLLRCLCPAPSQTRFQAPEYAKWPKMAYSARIMPQSYILLLRPYYVRNSAGRMCKGLLMARISCAVGTCNAMLRNRLESQMCSVLIFIMFRNTFPFKNTQLKATNVFRAILRGILTGSKVCSFFIFSAWPLIG